MANPNDSTDFIQELINNIYTVINTYQSYIGFRGLYKNDDDFIPRYPAITIELDSFSEEFKAMPRQKTITAIFSITYYYQNLSDKALRTKIREGLNKLANIFRENWDLNNYCPDLGSEVVSATPYIIARGEEIVAGGVISLEVRKVITVTLV